MKIEDIKIGMDILTPEDGICTVTDIYDNCIGVRDYYCFYIEFLPEQVQPLYYKDLPSHKKIALFSAWLGGNKILGSKEGFSGSWVYPSSPC